MTDTNHNIDSGSDTQSNTPEFDGDHKDIFYAAVQRSRMPMLLTDPNKEDNPIVFFNEAFHKLTGYEASEILGRNCRFLQGPASDRSKIDYIREKIAEEKNCSVEMLNYRKDGSTFWNALFISPVYDLQGKLVYFFASQLDVSRRVQSEELLRQAQKIETLGQLTGGIAHDFNNMLTVVMGNITMAQRGLERGNEIGHYLERAMSAAQSSDRLTQQLLSFARKQRMSKEKLDLNEVVRQVQVMFERLLVGGIYVSNDFVPGSWPVLIDASQAQSAFLNVLLNARDAFGPEGGTVKLRTRNIIVTPEAPHDLLDTGSYVEFAVCDNGRGMSPETVARVFEPFFTTKAVGHGTGMGMAMVHGFAEQSNAKLDVQSKIGEGTTITFYFPTADHHDMETEDHNSFRILVVEDNANLRETTVEFLRDHGLTVREADSAAQALQMIDNGYRPDIMFSDIIMPGAMDGFGLAKIVRQRYPEVHILLTSGWTNGLEKNANGEFEVLSKPYDLSKLASILTSMSQLAADSAHEG